MSPFEDFRTSSGELLTANELREYRIEKVCKEIDDSQRCVWCQCKGPVLQFKHRRPSYALMVLYGCIAIGQGLVTLMSFVMAVVFFVVDPLKVKDSMSSCTTAEIEDSEMLKKKFIHQEKF